MRKYWWKILSILLLAFAVIGGFLLPVPQLPIVHESIRNLYFHVPMWFTMVVLFVLSVVYSIKYLRTNDLKDDLYAMCYVSVGVVFSVLGMITGMEWAYYTWPADSQQANFLWTGDPKQLCSALCMLIYMAYLVLRGSIADFDKRAKISAVYNIFACALMFPLIFIIPRMVPSLHPGSDGTNPADPNHLDATMRLVFWPAVLGWILLSVWITTLLIRINLIAKKEILYSDVS
mgnify:CR=1 FL=1|jgi:heme exporter protein C